MDRVRVGIVGAGYWGPNLIRTFAGLDGCEVAWVCDRRPGRLQYIAERFPELPLTDRYDDLLADRRLDAIAIVTPPATHRALAEAALQVGKHVLVEKPLALTVEDAAALVEMADRLRLVLATGHVFVYHPAVAAIRDLARAGTLGDLCYAESDRVNLGHPDSAVDVIWDLAVHDVSVLVAVVGSTPAEVQVDARRWLHPTLTDVAFITLRFDGGFLAKLHVSWLSPMRVRRMFIAGTNGSAIFDDTRAEDKLVLIDRGVDTRVGAGDSTVRDLVYQPGKTQVCALPDVLPLTAECARFVQCVRSGGAPEADGHAGLAVVRVLDAARRSASNGGRPVRLGENPARGGAAPPAPA
ncbi:MAG TPA: Gfo/Idh/MocA family oxidoreductase [Chloroflexota bacterium]|nr:Gfo/Idh/MocA family oxidoreductase [Chloroflexota bacterium]